MLPPETTEVLFCLKSWSQHQCLLLPQQCRWLIISIVERFCFILSMILFSPRMRRMEHFRTRLGNNVLTPRCFRCHGEEFLKQNFPRDVSREDTCSISEGLMINITMSAYSNPLFMSSVFCVSVASGQLQSGNMMWKFSEVANS